MRFITLLFILILMGCIPAQVPSQLTFTPGASVVVTENFVTLVGIQVAYPAGWRVITSAAESSPYLTFVSPHADALIVVSTTATIKPPQIPTLTVKQQRVESQSISVNNQLLRLWFVSSQTTHARYLPEYQRVVASLHP